MFFVDGMIRVARIPSFSNAPFSFFALSFYSLWTLPPASFTKVLQSQFL